uniref:Putative tacc3 protein n=1 Tax=Rhipicephalus pulchellus TaxID=72859 RepID=L7M459_RHIPC
MFSEKEMSQALKYQELMFQERLLKKDQDCVRQLESVRQEVESYRSKLEESQKFCKMQEKALQNLKRDNENVLEALQSFTKEIQKERAEQEDSMQKVVKDRDQLAEDLHNIEMTFADFHRRYEKAKQVISVMKENEALLKQQLTEANDALEKNCNMVHIIKTKTEESIEGAIKEVENTKRNYEADITVLKGQLKKAAMTINSLEKRLEQKNEENTELTKLYDDLLNQVKAK